MLLAKRLRELREAKNLSQGDVERRAGLMRCSVSRVENGYATPSIETLERLAHALEIPLHLLFHEGKGPVEKPAFTVNNRNRALWGEAPKERRELKLFAKALARMDERGRNMLMKMASLMAEDRFH